MSDIRRNIIANYVGIFAITAGPILAIPWYLKLLGPENFGLISFATTLQAFLTLLESGISQVAAREFAVRMNQTTEGKKKAAQLLRALERVYWLIAAAGCAATLLMSGLISENWLALNKDLEPSGKQAIWSAAFIFLFQFPGALYRSFLTSAQNQVRLNGILTIFIVLRHVPGIALLTIRPQLSTYFAWNIISIAMETAVRRHYSWTATGTKKESLHLEKMEIYSILKGASSMSAAVLLGALSTQMDKILLTKMVAIELFGYYAVASTLAAGAIQMIQPVVQAMAPKIMQNATNQNALNLLNVKLTGLIALIILCGAITFFGMGKPFLTLWLKNQSTAEQVYELLKLLLIGSSLNALYHVGYFNWLARGQAGRIFLINIVSLGICLASIPALVRSFGIVGATFGFIAMNLIGFLISLDWVYPAIKGLKSRQEVEII